MKLELHDSSYDSFCGDRAAESDDEAENLVRETAKDKRYVKWVLLDDQGIRCEWERPEDKETLPKVTRRASRYTGKWRKNPAEMPLST